MTNKELFQKLGDGLVSDIKSKIVSSGANATGATANSLRHTETESEFVLYGSQSFKYIETGRGPGKQPPHENIKKWLVARGMDTKLVYAIAKKIAKQGTNIYANKTFRDIYTESSGNFYDILKDKFKIKLVNDLTIQIKQNGST